MTGRKGNKLINVVFIAIGAAVAAITFALWQVTGLSDAEWLVTGAIIGAILVLFGAIGLLRKDAPRGDERTRKLGAYAASWSWLSAVTVTSVLFLLDNRGIISLSASTALKAVLFTLLASLVAFSAYYRSRGDIE